MLCALFQRDHGQVFEIVLEGKKNRHLVDCSRKRLDFSPPFKSYKGGLLPALEYAYSNGSAISYFREQHLV